MINPSSREQQIIEKLRQLSPLQIAEIEELIDQLCQKTQEYEISVMFAQVSEPSFEQVWDNPEDAAYDSL